VRKLRFLLEEKVKSKSFIFLLIAFTAFTVWASFATGELGAIIFGLLVPFVALAIILDLVKQ